MLIGKPSTIATTIFSLQSLHSVNKQLLLLITISLLLLTSCVLSAPRKQQKLQKLRQRQEQESGHFRSKTLSERDVQFLKSKSVFEIQLEKKSHYRRTNFLKTLFHKYDRRVLPNLEEPTVVNCSLFINNFDSISEVTMDYAVGVYLRQAWRDPRLNFSKTDNNNEGSVTLDAKAFEQLWVPDLFFTNEKKAAFHEITVPNRLIRLDSNGNVLYSVRLSLTLSCVMDLRKFPLDSQVCTMMVESYAYTTDKIILQWRAEPLEVSKQMVIPQFNLRTFDFSDCSKRYATGNFSCLKASFYLDRDMGYYIIQTYLPSIMVVVLSWVAFWIDPTAVPARVTFGVFTTLILSTMSSTVRSTLPRVSYVKAIDVWMSVCMFFVFTALIEYAIVNVVLRQKSKKPLKPVKMRQPAMPPQSPTQTVRTRTPVYMGEATASPSVATRLIAPEGSDDKDRDDSIRSSSCADDRNKPYFRGHPLNKPQTPQTGMHSDNSTNRPEVWIPLESVPVVDSPSKAPPKSLAVQGNDDHGDNKADEATAPEAQADIDLLLIRGPNHLLDVAYYWHRTMVRLAEMDGKEKGQLVESWARKIFPLTFTLFNLVYWTIYLLYI